MIVENEAIILPSSRSQLKLSKIIFFQSQPLFLPIVLYPTLKFHSNNRCFVTKQSPVQLNATHPPSSHHAASSYFTLFSRPTPLLWQNPHNLDAHYFLSFTSLLHGQSLKMHRSYSSRLLPAHDETILHPFPYRPHDIPSALDFHYKLHQH